MNFRAIFAVSFLLSIITRGLFAAQPITASGPSEQFVVTGLRAGKPVPGIMTSTNSPYIVLDPALVAVSCERIKQALLRELSLKDHWRGKIFVHLQPRWKPDAQILVNSSCLGGRWTYGIDVPNEVEKERFLRVMVQVILLEIANRNAAVRQVELPPWLAEGLMAHLRETDLPHLLIQPETFLVLNESKTNTLAQARAVLRVRSPLSLDELNWPGPNQFSGENSLVYQCCAQLFVTELLRLKNGPECLSAMLEQLPQSLNWQTAFLRAFNLYFQRLIDVEKWWSLHLVRFTGRNPSPILALEESWHRLADILNTSVRMRGNNAELPDVSIVPLQTLIDKAEYHRQMPILRQKIAELQMLRFNISQDFAPLVESYQHVLESYLQRRSHTGVGADWKGQPVPSVKLILRDTLRHLNALDAQRERWRPTKDATLAEQTKPGK